MKRKIDYEVFKEYENGLTPADVKLKEIESFILKTTLIATLVLIIMVAEYSSEKAYITSIILLIFIIVIIIHAFYWKDIYKKNVEKIHKDFELKNEKTKFEYFQNNKNNFEKEYEELQMALSSFEKLKFNNLTLVKMKKDIQEKITLIEKLNTMYL